MAEVRNFDLQVEDIDKVIANVANIGDMMGKINWTVGIMHDISENNIMVGDAIHHALAAFGELSNVTAKSLETVNEIYEDLTTFRARQEENEAAFHI